MSTIPYGRQEITQADIDAVTKVLQSDFLTQGPAVPNFEQAVAKKLGAHYAIAVNSATSALHLSCLALGLGSGDWLWTSPITFVASANCGLYCGAQVDFVDIDPLTYNLCPIALKEKLEQAELQGNLPKVLVAVHLSGQSCDMAAIWALSQQYGFRIIEDASHAIGGKYQGAAIGGCQFSDITVFSFHPVKIITTGEGGMAVTNNADLAERIALLRSHGITREPYRMTEASEGDWYYQQIQLGYNYRMTDIQAALGLSQMTRLNSYVAARHQLAMRYNQFFADLPLTRPWQHPDCHSAYHLYIIRIPPEGTASTHREVFQAMRAENILVNLHYIPVHTQPYYQNLGFRHGDFPRAEQYYKEAISLPIYPTLTENDQEKVVAVLKKALRA